MLKESRCLTRKINLSVMIMVLTMISSYTLAQKVNVSGVVVDENDRPLAGVYIKVKNLKNQTLSDTAGRFQIYGEGSTLTLQFSYLRFPAEEVTTATNDHLKVVMKTLDTTLDAVVVVGYGTQRKSAVLGAISTVEAKEIDRVPATNLSQAIVGKLPGLVTRQESGLPGSDQVGIYVRGFSSLNNNAPLVLVDGVERSISTIDPSAIESVTILKDAASAAVYGVRGANGVILVTTKKGTVGKPEFNYSTSYTLSQNTRLPKYLNGQEFVKWYNYADEINGRGATFPDEVVDKVNTGDPEGIYGNTDWMDLMLKSSSPTMKHNISLRGGDKSIRYFMDAGYLNQKGIIEGVDYNRYNLRLNIDANVTKAFSVSLNIAGNVNKANSPQVSNFSANGGSVTTNLMNQIITAHPYLNPRDSSGQYLTSALLSGDNPLAARNLSGYDNNDNSELQSSLTLEYKTPFVKGLSFKFVGSYDRNNYHSKSFYTPYTLWTANPTDATGTLYETASPYGTTALLTESYTQSYRWTTQEFINYNRVVNKNTFGAVMVAEQSGYHYTGLAAGAQNFDLTDLGEFAFAKDNPHKPTGSDGIVNRAGWVTRLNYSYAQRYYAEFSGRLDGSTNFPANNRYGFFPSLSLGWNLSKESFFKNLSQAITNMKLTASYGILGNDATSGTYEYLRFMALSSNPVANIGGVNVNSLSTTSYPNTALTWERSNTANIGLQVEFWGGKLSADFNGFYKVTNDILTSVSSTYPPSLGGYYPSTVNSGKVDNRGFELVLNHKNTIGALRYSVTGSVSWAHNRILNMDQSASIPAYQSMIGQSMGAKTGLVSLGLFQTDQEAQLYPNVSSTAQAGDIRYKDLNGDGKITYEQDVTIIGRSSFPELNYSLNYDANWKNFEFSFLFQGAAIADNALMGDYPGIGWDDSQFTRDFYNGGNSPKYLIEGSWSPTNPNGEFPRLDNQWRPENNWASSFWIINGAYLRLKNVSLAYNFKLKAGTEKSPINGQIYLAGMNLVTFSPFKYLDPEAPNVSNGYYPQQKTYSLGFRITF